jgi:hypothetical protein
MGAPRIIYRYVSGRPMDGRPRTDGGYLRPGQRAVSGYVGPWGRLPGWQRQAWRLGVPGATLSTLLAYHAHPHLTVSTATVAGAVSGVHGARALRHRWRMRRFNATYIRPTQAALRLALGDAPVRLRVDPTLGTLLPRLAKPMSPMEARLRTWYGAYLEPTVRWLPERGMRAGWAARRLVRPVTDWAGRELRRPQPADAGPRIELDARVLYLAPEQRAIIKAIIGEKIPAGELNTPDWDQVGDRVTATWTVRKRPPADVGYADLAARFDGLKEHEFFIGLGVGGKPVVLDLKDEAPHIALSAGTGAGKSTFAQQVAVQMLARGGRVVILDRKGSHRWAIGMPGVDYCSQPKEMSKALVDLAALADERNALAFWEDDGWNPGQRVLVIAEELNATFAQLRAWWARTRGKGDEKIPPAVTAFREILFMGRSANIHLLAIAQMLTANTTGGPETRENFGYRCLARYTKNNWQMLVPEASMPRSSRTLGRWQVVIGGEATETQVCFLSPAEARIFVHQRRPRVHVDHGNQGVHVDVPGQGPIKGERGHVDTGPAPTLTLQDSIDERMCPWKLPATQKRLQRAREAKRAGVPQPVGKRQRADVYERGALIAWFADELGLAAAEPVEVDQ